MAKGIAISLGTTVVHKILDDGTAAFNGNVSITGSLSPNGDGITENGGPNNRWADFYAIQQTVGAIFETGLTTPGINLLKTGTVLVWRKDGLIECQTEEDPLVMGVAKEGKDQPIVFGAEYVLVTGDIDVGDFIVTSTKVGHGQRAKRKKFIFFDKDMTGKIIGQALEPATGESSLIKCMINKT